MPARVRVMPVGLSPSVTGNADVFEKRNLRTNRAGKKAKHYFLSIFW